MNLDIDKWPYVLNLTAIEATCVIEALAAKATEDRRRAIDTEYENNELRNKTDDLEKRVRTIELSIMEDK